MLVPSFPSLFQRENSKNWQGQFVTDRGGDRQRSWLSRKSLYKTSEDFQIPMGHSFAIETKNPSNS